MLRNKNAVKNIHTLMLSEQLTRLVTKKSMDD